MGYSLAIGCRDGVQIEHGLAIDRWVLSEHGLLRCVPDWTWGVELGTVWTLVTDMR